MTGDAEKGRVGQYITNMDKIVIKFPSLDTEFLGIYCLFFFLCFFVFFFLNKTSILLFYSLNEFWYFKSAQHFHVVVWNYNKKERKMKRTLAKQPTILLQKQRTWFKKKKKCCRCLTRMEKKAFFLSFWVSILEPFAWRCFCPTMSVNVYI